MKTHFLLSTTVLALLTACGGGGDGNSNINNPTTDNTSATTNGLNKVVSSPYTIEEDSSDPWDKLQEIKFQRNGNTLIEANANKQQVSIYASQFPIGLHEFPVQFSVVNTNGERGSAEATMRSYKAFYSGVAAYGKLNNVLGFKQESTIGSIAPYYDATTTS